MNLDPIKTQYDENDLKRMTAEEIAAAEAAGQFDDILGRSRFPSRGQLNAEHIQRMNKEEIRQAYRQGRLTELLDTTD